MMKEQMKNLISKTIGTCLQERAYQSPHLTGMGFRDDSYDWKEVDEISDFLALRYLKLGIRRGDHAAIWSVNSPNAALCFFALSKIGAVICMVNTCYKEQEMKDILEDNDITYLFYGSGCRDVIYKEILHKIPLSLLPKLKLRIELEEHTPENWYQRQAFPKKLSEYDLCRLKEAVRQVTPMDIACILFTSGTTSRPKGVMLSHDSLIHNSAEIVRQMHWNETDKFCISVPIFHCFGITAGLLACVHSGAAAHLLKYYKTLEVLKEVQNHRCTVLSGVPTMFLALLRNKNRENYDLSSLSGGIIAGSPVLPAEYMAICRGLNLTHLQVSYGQTESSPCVTISDYEDSMERKSETAGKRIRDIQLEIMDMDTNMLAEVGQKGEILTRGYHIMKGYYNRPAETKEAVDEDGWLHTGDIGYLDEAGYLHVTGRKKDLIIRGGENISPLEIENCLIQLPEVEAVKVIGIPAEVLQEEIAACIIGKEQMVLNEEEVQAYVKEKIADYKVPKYILKFQSFPINASGKIQTEELRAQAREMIKRKHKEEQTCILQNSMN